jgi:hypothetical protein
LQFEFLRRAEPGPAEGQHLLAKFAVLIFWGELGLFKFAAGICRAHSAVE